MKPQSACLRRKAGISISSMPRLASVSTLVRAFRHTLANSGMDEIEIPAFLRKQAD
jgi:hypothetical protein